MDHAHAGLGLIATIESLVWNRLYEASGTSNLLSFHIQLYYLESRLTAKDLSDIG